MRISSHPLAGRLVWLLPLCLAMTALPAAAVTFVVSYDDTGSGAVDPCSIIINGMGQLEYQYEACAGGVDKTPQLDALVDAAAAHWEDIIEDVQIINLRYWWHDDGSADANVTNLDGNGQPTDVRIRIPVDNTWFYDATPADDSEFQMSPKLYRTTHPDEQAEAFSGNPPEIFEVGYNGKESPSKPNDLLTVILHEIGHTLGLEADVIGAGAPTCQAGPNNFYDLDASLLGGAVMGLKGFVAADLAEDCQHLALGGITACNGNESCESHQALMWPGFFPNHRARPDIATILAIATAAGWQDLDLPRKFSLGSGTWNNNATWLGDRNPDGADDVYIANTVLTTISVFGGGIVRDIHVSDGNSLSVFSLLTAAGTITVEGAGSDVTADFGSTIDATDINIEADGLLDVASGVVDTFRLRNESQIRGSGTIDVVSLTNNREIRSNGGHLLFTTSNFNAAFDLDGSPDASFVSIEAVFGDVTFDGGITDPIQADLRVGAGQTLTFVDGWEQGFKLGVELLLEGSNLEATLSGHSLLGGYMAVEGLGRFTDEATFQPGARLNITLNGTTPGTEHSQLNGDDTIFLGGTLRILLEPGYVPSANDSFTILTAPSVMGQFDSIQGLDIAGTLLTFDVIYNPTSVVLAARGPAGAVPDGQNVPGVPLTVEHAGGADITLQWGDSCFGERDYEVYEGVLGGDFTSHSYLFCTTDANTSKTFTPSGGDRYYLVVPTTGHREGSYGVDSDLNQRPPGVRACSPQALVICGPT